MGSRAGSGSTMEGRPASGGQQRQPADQARGQPPPLARPTPFRAHSLPEALGPAQSIPACSQKFLTDVLDVVGALGYPSWVWLSNYLATPPPIPPPARPLLRAVRQEGPQPLP